MCDDHPGIQINNYSNTMQFVFNMNVGNIANPNLVYC